MSLPAATVWEVRTTGSDSSGGGFVAGATGSDFSQQDSAQYSGADLTVDGTTNTKVTSAGHSFVAADVGNLIQVTAGTGFTVGFYQIVSVASGAATLDRSPAAVTTAGGTYAVGGALLTIAKVAGAMAGSNRVWVKGGTYTITTSIALNTTTIAPTSAAMPHRISGYGTTRGDNLRPVISLSTNGSLIGLNATSGGWLIENVEVNGNGLANSTGIQFGGNYGSVRNCVVRNCTFIGFYLAGSPISLTDCEATGCSGSNGAVLTGSSGKLVRCNVHDNVCPGIVVGANSMVVDCKVTKNTGGVSDGIRLDYGCLCYGNTCHGNGRDGVRGTTSNFFAFAWHNNILSNNTGYGVTGSTAAGSPADPMWDGNAYYLNSAGNRNFMDDTTVNATNGQNPYARAFDVLLSGSPYTNVASDNYTLNAVAGAGAACRGTARPGVIVSAAGAGYRDFGAYQHQDPAGGGGGGPPGVVVANTIVYLD